MSAPSPNSLETARQGRELYERTIRREVERQAGVRGKMLALDVDSGEYRLAAGSLDAVEALKSHRPEARVYVIRVGHPTAVRIGASLRASDKESGE
jgi:hypothetical protein